MTQQVKIALAQLNFMLGDIENNAKKIIAAANKAYDELKCEVIIFPELALTGYPPEDLLLRPECHQRVSAAIKLIQQQSGLIHCVIGHPELHQGQLYNAASVIYDKKIVNTYYKQHLPNYGVFDEKRYFQAGNTPCVFEVKGFKLGINICEDIWQDGPFKQAYNAGMEIMLCLNASPFYYRRRLERLATLQQRQKSVAHVPIVYINLVGGQDELVFDGSSMVIDADGNLAQRSVAYQEAIDTICFEKKATKITTKKTYIVKQPIAEASIYSALVLGMRDYIKKNKFPGAIIGLSGGIDSALTLAIANDAIGNDKVEAVLMPSQFTSQMSIDDAIAQATAMNINYRIISIEPIFEAYMNSLSTAFSGLSLDTTEENLQARIRGALLMALSNKFGRLVLTTGNKSEMAVGYATLYGDMVGGYAVLKDVLKTWVYRLANYRNTLSAAIPERVITRPPSAELAHEQTDQDSLPPYDLLDQIIKRYVEFDQSHDDIIAAGFDKTMVDLTLKLIDRNEYKRRQAPPGVKITPRAFGRDWRYPITSDFLKGR